MAWISNIPSRFNLAVCYTKAGNFERAIAEYRKILDQDAGIYEARINLALLLDQSGKRSEAAGQYEKAVELRPDDPQAHLNLGLFYMRGRELDKAYSHLIAAAEKDLNSPELYIALSEAEHLRNDEAKSRMYLEKASQWAIGRPITSRMPATIAARRRLRPTAIQSMR